MGSIDFPGNSGQLLSFNPTKCGVEIIDHIERRRCQFETSQPTSPQSIPTDEFSFPVDHGISVVTDSLILPYTVAVYIRNHTGFMIDELTKGDFRQFSHDQYSIELSTPIKLYINIESGFTIDVTSENVVMDFSNQTEIYIGARSHHERPAATITTTSDPHDLMEAISYFGSALKTVTCERSYPTLRGHPPEVELGDKFHVPSVLEKPDTDVVIRVPPDCRSIYVVSPLAYYLAADIRPGDEPKLETNSGYTYDLIGDQHGFEKTVEHIMKKCFFLDCITRTEGYYQISLNERKKVEEILDLDFSEIYGEPLAEQIKTYLQVPYEHLSLHIPQWKLTAHIETQIDNIEFLPYLVNDLAVIRSAKETVVEYYTPELNKSDHEDSVQLGEFVRNDGGAGLLRGEPAEVANLRSNTKNMEKQEDYVQIAETDAREKTWIGDGIPVDASKAMIEAFRNRLQRDLIDEDIKITVVVNDKNMEEEGDIVDTIYRSREEMSFAVDVHQNLTIKKLNDVLLEETDFLHYIGHIDSNGFECVDGQLDMTDVDRTGVDTFLLNACSSYAQAIELIKSGSIVGIATVKPILDSGAKRVGETIAKLLNMGFPFMTALDIAKSKSIIGDNYLVIGDGQLNLTQSKSGAPSLCEISVEEDGNNIKYNTYPTRKRDLGSITIPYAKNNQDYFLTSGMTGEFNMDNNSLLQFLSMGEMPIQIDSKLYWSTDNQFISQIT